MSTKIAMIMSVGAAGDNDLRDMVGRLRRRGYEVDIRVSWEKGQAQMFSEEAAERGVDALVACGGDGTLHEVVNGVMTTESSPIVAGIPYGTANDFLDSVGIEPRQNPEQFEDLLDSEPTMIDLGCLGDQYFVNMATAGLGAEISAEASSALKDVAGGFAYFVSAIPAAFDIPTSATRVTAPDLQWEGEVAFLFVGNGTQSGGGWRFCPAANLDDGLLDIVIVPEMPLREMARYGREMFSAERPGDYGPIIYRQLKEVRVEFDDDVPINLDGEPFEGRGLEFRVEPQAIRFLLPPSPSS